MSCKTDCADTAKGKIDAAIDQWLIDGDTAAKDKAIDEANTELELCVARCSGSASVTLPKEVAPSLLNRRVKWIVWILIGLVAAAVLGAWIRWVVSGAVQPIVDRVAVIEADMRGVKGKQLGDKMTNDNLKSIDGHLVEIRDRLPNANP